MRLLFLVLCWVVFSAVPVVAGEIILVAPDLFYPNGYEEIDCESAGQEMCENRSSCEQAEGVYSVNLISNLGETVYFQLGTGLNRFNESYEARKAGKAFRVKALASPNCKNNLRVKKFYRSLKTPGFVDGILNKYKASMIVWGDFPAKKIRSCKKNATCNVPVTVGWETASARGKESFTLEYESKRKGFSPSSLQKMMNGLRYTYAKALLGSK